MDRVDLVRRPRLAGHPARDDLEDEHAPAVHGRESHEPRGRDAARQDREHLGLLCQGRDHVRLLGSAGLDEDVPAGSPR